MQQEVPSSSSNRRSNQSLHAIFDNYSDQDSSPELLPQSIQRPDRDQRFNISFTAPTSDFVNRFKMLPASNIAHKIDPIILNETIDNSPKKLKDAIQELTFFTDYKSQDPEELKDLTTRILFNGPSGSGKTTLAYAIAYKIKRPYVFVKSPELSNEYKQAFVTAIDCLFDQFLRNKQPGVIILDEITGFTDKINSKNDADIGAIHYLWEKIDDCLEHPQLLIICTTNNSNSLPITVQNRFAGCEYLIEHPNPIRKAKIIETFLTPLSSFDKSYIKKVSAACNNISLRELYEGLSKSRGKARTRSIMTKVPFKIEKNDIEETLMAIVKENSKKAYARRFEQIKEFLKSAGPYALTVATFTIGLYANYWLHTQNKQLTLNLHADNKAFNLKLHAENAAAGVRHHLESLVAAARQHKESLLQAQKHFVENTRITKEQQEITNNGGTSESWWWGVASGVGSALSSTAALAVVLEILKRLPTKSL